MSEFPQHHVVELNDRLQIDGIWHQVTTDGIGALILKKLPQEEQKIPEYVQNNIRDLNYFLVMLTDIANVYREKPTEKNARFVADHFTETMATALGYQKLERASRNLASALRYKGHEPNFVPEEETKDV